MKKLAAKTLKKKAPDTTVKAKPARKIAPPAKFPVSLQLLDIITKKAPFGLSIYNLKEKKYTFINKAIEAIYGPLPKSLTPEKLESYFIREIHPDDMQELSKHINDYQKGKLDTVAYRIKSPAKKWIWIEKQFTVISKDKKGKPVEILVAIINITAQKKAEERNQTCLKALKDTVDKKALQCQKVLEKLEAQNRELLALKNSLKESEESNKKLITSAQDIIFTVKMDGTILSLNPVFERFTGLKVKDCLGKPFYSLINPDEQDTVRKSLKSSKTMKHLPAQYYQLKKKDGSYLMVEATGTCMKMKDGSTQIVGIARDLTERMIIQQALKDTEAINTALLNASPDGAMIVDKDGKVLSLNDTMAGKIGLPKEKLIGMRVLDYLPPAISKERKNQIRTVIETGQPISFEEVKNITHLFVVIYPVMDINNKVDKVALFVRDITEYRKIEEALRSLSLLDDLTGLHNRRGFLNLGKQYLRMAQRQGKNLVLFYSDLDGMKKINDDYGHREGDWALKQVGHVLIDSFRKSDLLARIGGDEFVVLAMESQDFRVDSVVERIKSGLAAINKTSGKPVQLSMSIGWKKYDPDNPALIDDLLEAADRAMYEDKKKKKV
jgi:diguanylate cyclase (GGDEF)-like protein/PAS domain S-box-containing protein